MATESPTAARILAALREARGALTPARLAEAAGVSITEALDLAWTLPGVESDGLGFRLVRA